MSWLYSMGKTKSYPKTNKCIILDLDATLIATHQPDKKDQLPIVKLIDLGILTRPELSELRNRIYHLTIEDFEKPGIGTSFEYWGITRPHFKEFLAFCFEYFKFVGVWSAGRKLYVEAVVDWIFKDLPYPHVVWTHDDVIIGPKGYVEKHLSKMMSSISQLTPETTFVLDDTEMTFIKNPDNGVLIPPYDPEPTIAGLNKDDKALLQFRDWLLTDEVMKATDVRTLDKTHIFQEK